MSYLTAHNFFPGLSRQDSAYHCDSHTPRYQKIPTKLVASARHVQKNLKNC